MRPRSVGSKSPFRRSLEYPPNLGVGRPERANETEQKELLAKALAAAGMKE